MSRQTLGLRQDEFATVRHILDVLDQAVVVTALVIQRTGIEIDETTTRGDTGAAVTNDAASLDNCAGNIFDIERKTGEIRRCVDDETQGRATEIQFPGGGNRIVGQVDFDGGTTEA